MCDSQHDCDPPPLRNLHTRVASRDWCNGVPDNEKVTLSATWFARGAVGLHSCFPSLESLTVDAEGIYRCGLDIYPGALPTFQNLRELTVNRFCFHSSPQPEAFVSLAPNLASLVVSELPMSDLTPLANHPTLEKLTLSGYQTDTLDVEGVPTYDAILRSLPRLGRVTLEGRGWNLWPGEADDPYDCASALLRSLAAWRAGRLTQFVYEVAEPDSAALPLGYVLPRLAAELGPSLNWLELYPCRLPRARGGGGLPESVREGGLLCLPLFERLRYMELHVEAEMDEGPVRLPIAKERIDALVQPLVYGGCVAPCLRELVVKLPAGAVTSGVWAHCESMSAECPGGVLRFELV
ncbi:hypothetical protein MNEG_2151 [Monoraphidium neglectum]|uniref:Uncharacterized protein n=1 Tax=Monoraphidium neglectum TaxID=145388 RepID=A0A0D2NMG3_9CHLO|nr:hypothetical protein MNEG_2151 [Monoraphidium neglectum]KIZ05816.1 hypothetical protein MNEG_2151 [Monoraphidium neglectum]|eukprot:XP_013904835.1 hypothetical protein MNEG_2151 [Monoraphidium neglectum]